MTWLNEAEIDDLRERYARDPLLGPAAQYLSDYRDLINGCSDGWCHWAHGTRCAGSLSALLQRADHYRRGFAIRLPGTYRYPTRKDVTAAAARIERFVQREPQLAGQTPPSLRPGPVRAG